MADTWKQIQQDHRDDINNIFNLAYYRDKVSYPLQANVFRALDLCAFENTKVVILGEEPPCTEMADGLAYSSSRGVRPSLKVIFRELERTLGIKNKKGDLSAWASQGVLLLNILLTVEKGKPGSHKNLGWEQFTADILLRLRNTVSPVFVTLGGPARRFLAELNIKGPHATVLNIANPSPLKNKGSFEGSDVFRRINSKLVSKGQASIDWRLP
jgi:uracil-DNA glycosylase